MQYPVISPDPAIQAHYELSRTAGTSHGLAELLALQTFPGIKGTDSASFWSGRWDKDTPEVSEYRRIAEAKGVSTTGKFYQSGLANFPGDPKAFVSDGHDVLALAKERGITLRGAVNYTPPEGLYDPGPPVKGKRLAPDLVEEGVEDFLVSNPDATPAEATAAAIQKHGYGDE